MPDVGEQAFIDAAISKEFVTYLDLVAAAVLAYDYSLNIADEARFIWFSPFSLGKSLYFLTRYPVIIDMSLVLYHQFAVLSPGRCDLLYKVIGYMLGVGTLISESILVMRTWVIWNRNRMVGLALVTGLVLCWVPVFYFLAQSLNSLVFADPPAPGLTGCYLHSQKNILFAVFLTVTGFESIILILTLIRFAPGWKRKRTALIHTIYRDGIFNYVYLCILSVLNVVVLLTAPHGYSTLLSALQRVMHSILSSRVLLNLRQAAAAPAFIETIAETNASYRNSAVLFQPFATFFATGNDDGEDTGTSADQDGMALRDIRRSSMSDEFEYDVDEGPSRRGSGPTFATKKAGMP
ncbi:hypothetical protein EIP91_003307 [Steccherinum ochraceum]|uniref:DUF6533 domain-containing protein n=1 Tax=Steccherinum ochraceum TaxID=92696 RepID=A0A4R0RAP9_9APHY|nr:hypothetical protein EIP91_003307 [Steccherinum ochraceum]